MQNRKKWKTRVELANAMFDYIEIFYNRQRRHSQLGYRTPIEFELTYDNLSRVKELAEFRLQESRVSRGRPAPGERPVGCSRRGPRAV